MRQSRKQTKNKRRDAGYRHVKLAVFGLAVVFVLGLVVWGVSRQVIPMLTSVQGNRLEISMAGWNPTEIRVKPGQRVAVTLVNLDDSHHTDGGGWHDFRIDALGINERVAPLSTHTFTFVAPGKPGRYDFYCDICCGGKANPSMHGTLVVES